MKKNIIFAALICMLFSISYFLNTKFYTDKHYLEPLDIPTVCSSCSNRSTNCVYAKWNSVFREERDFVEVCDNKNYCKWRDVKKGGEWFYRFEWAQKTLSCEVSNK